MEGGLKNKLTLSRHAGVKKSFQVVPADPDLADPATNDLTTEIYASNIVLEDLLLKYGFFYIEMQCGYTTEIIGTDFLSQNIQGIVNRYYSLGSFTSSEGSEIIYQHKGVPIYLRDVKVRILDSDRQLATFLGPDNTIFVSIIRGQ